MRDLGKIGGVVHDLGGHWLPDAEAGIETGNHGGGAQHAACGFHKESPVPLSRSSLVAALRCFFVWGAFHSPEAPTCRATKNEQGGSRTKLHIRQELAAAVNLDVRTRVKPPG